MRLKDDIQKIRKILIKGPQTWGELMKIIGSPSVLKNRIDLLMTRGDLMATVGKRKGRRTTVYKLTEKEKAKAEIKRYESIEFIESMQNPIYVSIPSEDKKVRTSVFVSIPELPLKLKGRPKQFVNKILQNQAEGYTKSLLKYFERNPIILKIPSGVNLAIVLTKENL